MCVEYINWPILSIYALAFISIASMSVIAPFFPSEAASKGMSASTAGGVFSVFGFVSIVANLVIAKMLPKIGSKITLTAGILLAGLSNVIFGLLVYINNIDVFTYSCYVVRVMEAIGAAAINAAIYMILIQKCADNLNKAVANKVVSNSIGITIGPPLGSLLYTIGGYKLPFVVLGVALLMNILPTAFLIENFREYAVAQSHMSDERSLNYIRLLSMPRVAVVCLIVVIVGNNFGVHASTLELYLESYEIGPKNVGYVFMLMSASFLVFSMLVGNFLKEANGFKNFSVGLLFNTFAFLIVGPSPFFVLRGKLVVVVFSLFVNGAGDAFALVPGLRTILDIIADYGYTNSVTNSSYASGIYMTFYFIGYAVGPYFGAALFQFYNAHILFTVIALLNFICALLTMFTLANRRRTTEERSRDYTEIE